MMQRHRLRRGRLNRSTWEQEDGNIFCHHGLNEWFVVPRAASVVDVVIITSPTTDEDRLWINDSRFTYQCVRTHIGFWLAYVEDYARVRQVEPGRTFQAIRMPLVGSDVTHCWLALEIIE